MIPKGIKSIGNKKIKKDEITWSNLRNWGGESLRTDAKNCFYPVIIENDQVKGFGDVLSDNEHPKSQTMKFGNKFLIYPIDKEGVERKWRYARQSVEGIKNLLRAKKTNGGYEIELGKDFGVYRTVWQDSRYDANIYGTQIVKNLVPKCKFDFPKSLWNVYDCLFAVIANDKDAIVLDFFAGSGTTAHAVIELNKDGGNRKFILVEQMDYVEDCTLPRVQKVLGLQNTSDSFLYLELAKWNQNFIEQIITAGSSKELHDLWCLLKQKAHISYKVNIAVFDKNAEDFDRLSLENQKRFLLETLDQNHLYINYGEMDDPTYEVSKSDKNLNSAFYGK